VLSMLIGILILILMVIGVLIGFAWHRFIQSAPRSLPGDQPLSPQAAVESELGAPSKSNLTPREKDVLILLADGLSSKEIGKVLKISPRTVEDYRTSIYQKLGGNSPLIIVDHIKNHNLN